MNSKEWEREFSRLRAAVEAHATASRERSLVLTKLDEAELWLTRCSSAGEAS